MTLQNRLFFSITLLLLIVVVPLYFLARYTLDEDIGVTANKVSAFVAEEEAIESHEERRWIDTAIAAIEETLNATLLFTQKTVKGEPQEIATNLSCAGPQVGLIQVHDLSNNKVTTVVPGAPFYQIQTVVAAKGVSFALLKRKEKEALYLVQPISGGLSLLFDWSQMGEKERFALTSTRLIDGKQTVNTHPFWALRCEMISKLAPLYFEGLPLEGVTIAPSGIAVTAPDGSGQALLSLELFRTTSLFDDKSYYAKNAPQKGWPQIANSTVLVFDPKSKEVFYSNTLSENSLLITVGYPITLLTKQMAEVTHKDLLFSFENRLLLGFNAKGERLPDLAFTHAPQGEKGSLPIENTLYDFTRISLKGSKGAFYLLTSFGEKDAILNTFSNLHKTLVQKLSLHILALVIPFLILAVFIVWYISRYLSRPISALSRATTLIADGKYDEVKFPKSTDKNSEMAHLIEAFKGMCQGLEERERIRGVLNKVVSKEVAEAILHQPLHLGGEEKIVTILFSDIRNFTKMSLPMPPQEIVKMLNIFMTKMSRVIEGEGGVIDKYVGDEIMALFGTPISNEDHAIRALSSAKLMIETLKNWNQERAKQGLFPVEIGIGIHTGLVVAGNMGAEDRLNYTVIGADVNLAARLCQAAKPMQILISEKTLNELNVKDSFYVNKLEPIFVKGFDQPVSVYEIVGFKWDSV